MNTTKNVWWLNSVGITGSTPFTDSNYLLTIERDNIDLSTYF